MERKALTKRVKSDGVLSGANFGNVLDGTKNVQTSLCVLRMA